MTSYAMTSSPQNLAFGATTEFDNCFWLWVSSCLRPFLSLILYNSYKFTFGSFSSNYRVSKSERRGSFSLVSDISEKCGTLKWFGNFRVWFTDDLVNGFLPAGIGVAAFFDVGEELADRCQWAFEELVRDLNQVLISFFNNEIFHPSLPESAFIERFANFKWCWEWPLIQQWIRMQYWMPIGYNTVAVNCHKQLSN